MNMYTTRKYNMNIKALFAALSLVIILAACEDEPPNAYEPEPFIEGYMLVNEPIHGIRVFVSQPLDQAFSYTTGIVPDADVKVIGGGETYQLDYREVDGVGEYYYPDTTVTTKEMTEYRLEVTLNDGTFLTGTTTTPKAITWTIEPKATLQYPADTVNLPTPDSLEIAWTPGNNSEWLIAVFSLDTLGYGKYLTPPTDEVNDRTNNLDFFEDPEIPQYYSNVRWGFLQSTRVPTVWTAFRWYGRNDVVVFAPDKAMLDWFKVTQFQGTAEYNEAFSNIEGGLGVFGSASRIKKEVFLLKWR